MKKLTRVGLVGTGFIARGFSLTVSRCHDLTISRALTRRDIKKCNDFPLPNLLTNSLQELLEFSDLIVECCGDPIHATEVIGKAIGLGIPVVTMDSEFQVTTGSYFVEKGLITEAHGDQPGCLAALRNDSVAMGFKPLVYGNIKGFLNYNPGLEEMLFWSKKQGISLEQVVSFTDGTKIQVEQALVANGLGATIIKPGMAGAELHDLNTGSRVLATKSKELGMAVSDYVLSKDLPAGVFIVAENDQEQQEYLRYLKMGDGPFYTLLSNYHLCHLEIAKTIRMVLNERKPLLDNSRRPTVSVAAVAKKQLWPRKKITRGLGSFDVRGIAVKIADYPNHVPIGLIDNAVLIRTIKPGQIIEFSDIELPESLALQIWFKINKGVA